MDSRRFILALFLIAAMFCVTSLVAAAMLTDNPNMAQLAWLSVPIVIGFMLL